MSNVAPADKLNDKLEFNPSERSLTVSSKYVEDPSRTMMAAEWHGTETIKVVQRPAPDITDPCDVIVRVTSMTVCGSDSHMYFNELPAPRGTGMQKGDIMGHESMGVIDRVGPGVKNLKVGQRVVVSAPIACGQCGYCAEEKYSLCDTTNPAKSTEYLYGHRTAGIFGYSHLTGGIAGGQAEYLRVPFADLNCLPVPDSLTDEQVLLLSDVICTGYHGTELAEVKPGAHVVVWGCGPVGLMAAYFSLMKGAATVISVDNNPKRLAKAASFGAIPVNYDECNLTEEIARRIPHGPTNCIDCVGYRFPKSTLSWLQMKLRLETDSIDVVNEMILCGRKGARLALIGDYFAKANMFNIGAFMEKAQSMAGGQLYCQKYWGFLLSLIESGEVDATFLFTHKFHISEIDQAYKIFCNAQDDCVKVIVKTDFGLSLEKQQGAQNPAKSFAGQGFGKLNEMPAKVASHNGKPVHLRNANGQPQVLDHAGPAGLVHSVYHQGSTNSNMGTAVTTNQLSQPGQVPSAGNVGTVSSAGNAGTSSSAATTRVA